MNTFIPCYFYTFIWYLVFLTLIKNYFVPNSGKHFWLIVLQVCISWDTLSLYLARKRKEINEKIRKLFRLIFFLKARNQENEKYLANFLTPNFFVHEMEDIDLKNLPWKFLVFLCVVFEIFEVWVMFLYGNTTTVYGISWKIWSLLSLKLNMEISWYCHSCYITIDCHLRNYLIT